MSIVQGYRGAANLGTAIRMPVLPGSTISMPKNYQFPPIAHNSAFQLLHGEGLQVPMLDVLAVPMKTWFTSTNLNAWFITRTSDDTAIVAGTNDYGGELFDGHAGTKAKNIKANTLMLSSSQGQPISCRMGFMGTEIAQLSAPTYAVITEPPLMWDKVSFSGVANVVGWQFMLTNNCTPHPAHNGSVHPQEINAGQFMASLRLTLPADEDVPTDGDTITITISTDTGTGVIIDCLNPLVMAPDEHAIQMGRAFRQYDLNLLNGDLAAPITETCPVTISAVT